LLADQVAWNKNKAHTQTAGIYQVVSFHPGQRCVRLSQQTVKKESGQLSQKAL
jgi:hypothetical protein